MGWFEFISDLADSLAWPLVALIALFTLRGHLVELLGKLSKITFPGGGAEFRSGLAMAEAGVANETIPEREDGAGLNAGAAPSEVLERDPLALAANPTGVIMEAWKELEAGARSRQ